MADGRGRGAGGGRGSSPSRRDHADADLADHPWMADGAGAGGGGGGRGASPSRRDLGDADHPWMWDGRGAGAGGRRGAGAGGRRGAGAGAGGGGASASPSRRDLGDADHPWMWDGRGAGAGGLRDAGADAALGAADLADHPQRRRRDHVALSDAAYHPHMPIFAGFENSDAYPGEFEDKEYLSSLLSEQEHPPLIQELFGQVTGEPAAPAQPDTALAGLLSEQEHPPLIQELFGQVTGEPAAPAQPDTAPAGALAEDAALNAEVIDNNESFLDIYSTDSAENVVTALIASEIYAEMTENEATLPNIMAPVEDASSELENANLHALRGSDREDEFVMVPFNMIVVEPDEEIQGNAGGLDSYLHEGQWEHALRHLDHMVREGEADNGAVKAGAPERDIYKAHPELVLWLRGQQYVEMLKQGCTMAADAYYRDYIADLYPDGVSTGSTFADSTILGSLKKIKRTGSPLRRSRAFVDRKETRQCVQDYLKVYFPGYRPQLRETESRVWEFGRKDGDAVRCFLCHKEYRGLNLTKLEQHLLGLGQGRQGKCPAVTIYVTQRLEQILAAEDVAGSRRRGPRAVLPPPPPPPPPDAAADAAAP